MYVRVFNCRKTMKYSPQYFNHLYRQGSIVFWDASVELAVFCISGAVCLQEVLPCKGKALT